MKFAASLLFLVLGALPVARADFYVSPAGLDSNPGTLAAPFATLTAAQAAVRALSSSRGLPSGGLTVWLRAGYYNLSASLVFTSSDSGTASSPIVYSSYPGEQAYVTGGATLDPSWFTLLDATSPVWNRLDPAAQGQVYSINLAAHGITNYGTFKPRGFVIHATAPLELFCNGRPMTLGQWPVPGTPMALTVTAPSASQFTYSGTRPSRWLQAQDIWMHGLWSQDWADFHVEVASINPNSQTITLAAPPAQYGIAPNQPYYAYNLLEEIDQPGEYYVDRVAGILYFWPPGPLAGSLLQVSMMEGFLLQFSGAEYISMRNLVLEVARGPLISADTGDHIAFQGCLLRNAGEYAAEIGGSNNGFDHCEIANLGEEGVLMDGGDRASLTAGGNYVTNSRIHHTARIGWTYKPGVNFTDGSGNIVANNQFSEMPHSAILLIGNNHLIAGNEIWHVCQLTSDSGAIYTGRDWGYRGNTIEDNFVHDIVSSIGGQGANGVYLDDCMSGFSVLSNVFYNISSAAIFLGGGRDNIMQNNLIANSGQAHYNDDRGRTRIDNIPGDSWNLLERLTNEGIEYQSNPWATAFPACAAIPFSFSQIEQGLWRNPQNCVFSTNAGWNNTSWTVENDSSGTGVFSVYASFTNNSSTQTPLFTAAAVADRTLRPATLTAGLPGFQPIPFAAIGPAASPVVPTQAPGVPLLSGSASSSSEIDLQWYANGFPSLMQATGLELQGQTASGTWQALQEFGPDVDYTSQTGLPPGATYAYRLRSYNAAGSTYSNTLSVTTLAPPPVLGTPVIVMASAPLTVITDRMINGTVGISQGTLDLGSSVRLYDAGDTIRMTFTLATSGTYQLGVRVRAGGTTGPTVFWPSGYSFKLDGSPLTLTGDSTTISALDPAYGGCYWGTMSSSVLTLGAGPHTVDVTAQASWAVCDYLQYAAAAGTGSGPVAGSPPSLTVPANLTVTATAASGAVVTFATAAEDSAGHPLATTATPVSGALFPVGTTTVAVSATDSTGATSQASFTVTVLAPGGSGASAPSTPTGLLATAGDGQVALSWNPAAEATAYTVARGTVNGGPYAPVATGITATHYTDTGLADGTVYFYVVAGTSGASASAPSLQASAAPAATVQPTGWTGADIGAVGTPGSSSFISGGFTLTSSGADIWGSADAFRYEFQTMTGDGSMTARVTSIQAADPWTKAGVMIRSTLDAGAPFAAVYLTPPNNGVNLQWRPTPGGGCQGLQTGGPAAPYWIRLTRAGNVFTAYSSPDGTTWTAQGSTTIAMAANVSVGLALTAHNNAAVATARFDSIAVQAGTPSAPTPIPPTITVPAAIVAQATGPSGATVTFQVSALDSSGHALTASASPASGSTFPLGVTPVTVSATDALGAQATQSFSVTVRDTTPPVITVPAPISVTATSAAGAVVSFGTFALDTVSGTLPTINVPASGSTFPVGTTPVVATATDGAGNTGSASFTVTVAPLPAGPMVPAAPTGLTASGGNGQISLAWTGSAQATGYTVERSLISGGPYVTVASGLTTSSYTDSGLVNGTVYTYVIAATNAAGMSQLSSPASAAPSAGWSVSGWTGTDIGAVSTPGSSSYSQGTFTLSSSGADIWGTADAFRFVAQGLTGDGTITARVTGLHYPDPWSKAGVMIRESLNPGSTFAAMYLTPPYNGVNFQWRQATGGGCGGSQVGGPIAPYWVRLTRTGTSFAAFSSADGLTWTPQGVMAIPMASAVYVGLAVTAHNNAAVAAATFDSVTVQGSVSGPPPAASPPVLTVPAPITAAATGPTGAVVTFTTSAVDSQGNALSTVAVPASGSTFPLGVTTVAVSATDHSGATATQTFTVTVADTTPPHLTVPAPITVAATSAAGAVVTFTASAVDVVSGSIAASSTPASGSLFPVGTTTVTVQAQGPAGNTASQTFTITVTPFASSPPPPPAAGAGAWAASDIGAVNVPGHSSQTGGIFSLTSTSADIWGNADAFRFVDQALSGDGTITARVTGIQDTDPWTKAGVMIRETLDPGSAFAAIYLTPPYNGVNVQWRPAANNGCQGTQAGGPTAPYWVRITRTGSQLAAFSSPDGLTWTAQGTLTIPMATTVYAGLALTSHNPGAAATATFDSVTLQGATGPTAPPAPTGLTAVASNAQVALTWATVSGATAYNVKRGSVSGGPYTALATGLSAAAYTDTAVVNGTAYFYVVTATGAAGGSGNSNEATAVPSAPAAAPAAGWTGADIGAVTVPGSSSVVNGLYTLTSESADIWGNADAFRYVYTSLTGNGSITARVTAIQDTDPWTKAGVMIRQSVDPGSIFAALYLTPPYNGVNLQWRPVAANGCQGTEKGGPTSPYWVRITRTGSVLTAASSPDGIAWTVQGTLTLPLTATVTVGVALTSHNPGAAATASFDQVSVQPASGP